MVSDTQGERQERGDPDHASPLSIPLRAVEASIKSASMEPIVIRGRALLGLQDLFCRIAEIDRDTANALPVPASEVMRRVASRLGATASDPSEWIDSSLLIATWAEKSIATIVRGPRHRMRRQHTPLRLQKVREVDVRGLQWLTQQPGATAREKLAHAKRMLAVIRPWVPDTHENRVTCRVIADCRAILARRHTGKRKRDAQSEEVGIEATVESLWRACTELFKRSPLANVRPAGSFTPNNVLLGDRDYKRVWKLATWMRMREEHFSAVWSRGSEILAAAVALAVEATLLDLSNTHCAGTWLRVTPGGPEGCTVRELPEQSPDAHGFRWWLCNLRERDGTAFGIRHGGENVEFQIGPLGQQHADKHGFSQAIARVGFLGLQDENSTGGGFFCSLLIDDEQPVSREYAIHGGLALDSRATRHSRHSRRTAPTIVIRVECEIRRCTSEKAFAGRRCRSVWRGRESGGDFRRTGSSVRAGRRRALEGGG